MIGTTVGSYRITQRVSVGGMGTVYKAQHSLIGKLAAVKVLHPELRSNREVVNRFFNEAKATTQIKHPGIVEIFDFGYLPSGDGYIVMEFLEGVSLARRLRKGKMQEGKAAVLLKSVCSALAAAHAKHIVHRDLKPDNIFLCPDPEQPGGERPKLLDFGIAKLTDVGGLGGSAATRTGMVMGTPTYMAPEQCSGAGAIDHRADLYSLGCIFYELVCGVAPFEAEGAGALLGMHLYVEPKPPSTHESSISADAEALILSLLKKDPAERPQTAQELSHRFAALAQSAGWLGDNAPNAVVPEADEPEEPLSDDESVADGASAAAASPHEPASRPPLPGPGPNPTTLSAAASQSVIDVPRSNKGRWIGGVGVAAAAAVALLVMFTGGSDNKSGDATHPAAAPAASTGSAEPEVPVPPEPTAVTEPPPGPSTAASDRGSGATPKSAASTKSGADAAGSASRSGSDAPVTRSATATSTSEPKPTRAATTKNVKPTPTGRATAPAVTKSRKPRTNDAESRPRGTKKGPASGTKILIETDI